MAEQRENGFVGALVGELTVHECRSLADKGAALDYCVCVASIVRTSYDSLEEEVISTHKYVSAPAHRHKLKLVRPRVWRQVPAKECSVNWLEHNRDGAFALRMHPRGIEMSWADAGDEDTGRQGKQTIDMTEKELRWYLTTKPRVKLEIFGVGTPTTPKCRFLGQAYLGWHDVEEHIRPGSRVGGEKIFLQLRPRSFKSRVRGYAVVSLNQTPMAAAAKIAPPLPASYTRSAKVALFCQVVKVEGLAPRGGGGEDVPRLTDPYVMLETLPRGKYSRAARTTTKFQTLSPVYDEAFVFAETRLEVRELRASVWDETTGSGHERLGQIVVPLEAIFHNMFCGSGGGGKGGKGGTASKVLEHVMVFELDPGGRGAGRADPNGRPALVHLSLWFAEPRECREACALLDRGFPGNVGEAVFYEPELRRLHVDIVGARNLPPKLKKNGFMAGRDTYCTVKMTGTQKISTQVQRSTLWPEFNEKFALVVARNQLHGPAAGGKADGDGEGSESHRAGDLGFNDEAGLAASRRLGAKSPILSIKMFDYEPIHQSLAGGDRLIGKLKVPVSNLPVSAGPGSSVAPQWLPLCGGSSFAGTRCNDCPPELLVRACFEAGNAKQEEAKAAIGSVSVALKAVYLEKSAAAIAEDRGGLYCLIKCGREMVKTPNRQARAARGAASGRRTERSARDTERSEGNDYQTLTSLLTHRSAGQNTGRTELDIFGQGEDELSSMVEFRMASHFGFPLLEVGEVIAIGIFDGEGQKLTKIGIRPSTFMARRNRMVWPISIEIAGESLRVGYLDFTVSLKYKSKLEMWSGYFSLPRPPSQYTDPLPLRVRHSAKVQEHDLLKGSFFMGEQKLQPEVCRIMLGTEGIKFSVRELRQRLAAVAESVRTMVPAHYLSRIQVYNPMSWERPWLSSGVVLASLIAIQLIELILPLALLAAVVVGCCLRVFQKEILGCAGGSSGGSSEDDEVEVDEAVERLLKLKESGADDGQNTKRLRGVRKVKLRVREALPSGGVLGGVRNRAEAASRKAEQVKEKVGDALSGALGGARAAAREKMLAVRRRAGLVVAADRYLQLKSQYEELKTYSGICQMLLADFNACLGQVKGLLYWSDPRITFFGITLILMTSVFIFAAGLKPAAQMVVVYVMRPPWAKDPFPPWVFLPFHRLAAIHESPLFCFL